MKNVKFLDAEEITLDAVQGEFVALQFGNEKFVIDTETLHDLTFRFAEMLAKVENKAEQASQDGLTVCSECCGKLH